MIQMNIFYAFRTYFLKIDRDVNYLLTDSLHGAETFLIC